MDDITHRKLAKEGHTGTNSAILGPFWRADTPWRENGTTITFDTPKDAQVSFLYGQVTDSHTGKPIPNASVELWQASTNGLYEQQDDKQVEHNLRGKFRTDAEGRYSCYCIRPTPYPVRPSSTLIFCRDARANCDSRSPTTAPAVRFSRCSTGIRTARPTSTSW